MTNKSKKQNLQKNRYNLAIALLIALISFLPYIHDFNYFKEKEGFSGFPSLRLGVWVVSMFVVAISGWVIAFVNAKGIRYRFAILAPIIMLSYQLLVYVLNKRDSSLNDFNVKVILDFLMLLLIIIMYFKLKKNE